MKMRLRTTQVFFRCVESLEALATDGKFELRTVSDLLPGRSRATMTDAEVTRVSAKATSLMTCLMAFTTKTTEHSICSQNHAMTLVHIGSGDVY